METKTSSTITTQPSVTYGFPKVRKITEKFDQDGRVIERTTEYEENVYPSFPTFPNYPPSSPWYVTCGGSSCSSDTKTYTTNSGSNIIN